MWWLVRKERDVSDHESKDRIQGTGYRAIAFRRPGSGGRGLPRVISCEGVRGVDATQRKK